MDEKKTQVFVRNPDSGEPWAHCGELPAKDDAECDGVWDSLATAIGRFITAEIDGDTATVDGIIPIEIQLKEMTAAEVAAMPEM